MKSVVLLLGVITAAVLVSVSGHGMVMDPINRSSRWREHEDAPVNFDDNGLYCGGKWVHWVQNNGKCGLCGDNWADPIPRANELGGTYGQGVIIKRYRPGDILLVRPLITANHLGFFTFQMCNMDKFGRESEECFDALPMFLINGESRYVIGSDPGYYDVPLQIPSDLICQHCILQWTYTTGNSWGECADGTTEQGCGNQETFRTCSDISII